MFLNLGLLENQGPFSRFMLLTVIAFQVNYINPANRFLISYERITVSQIRVNWLQNAQNCTVVYRNTSTSVNVVQVHVRRKSIQREVDGEGPVYKHKVNPCITNLT